MSIVKYTDEEFNVFYYGLKNKFKTTSKIKSIESEEFEYYSESVKLNIDSSFETIFGQRYNSSLLDHYKQVFYEVKDEDERNSKIISQVIDNFYYSLNFYYTVEIQSRYFYFLEALSIVKKIGFQNGDSKFKNFIIKLILQEMRFEDGNFILLDKNYGTIINALITECVKNIRCEMIQNIFDLDCKDLIKDINKLEIEINIGSFKFLVTSLNLLRILKADIKEQYEGFNSNVEPYLHLTTINNHNTNVNNTQHNTNTSVNKTTNNQFNDNRQQENISIDNYFTDINNTNHNHTIYSNTFSYPKYEKSNIPINESEKKNSELKIEINFSTIKFGKLLIKFFENANIKMDDDKKNRVHRFILNKVNSESKNNTVTGSPSNLTINFFDKKDASILKFCALLMYLMEIKKISKIKNSPLEKILLDEFKDLHKRGFGISQNLGDQINAKLKDLTKIQLAKFAGFKNCIEINSIISN